MNPAVVIPRWSVAVVVGLTALAAGFGGNVVSSRRAAANDYLPSGSAAPRSGRELVLVYIGAAGCSWSNRPGLADAVKNVKVILSDSAARAHRPFSAIGVARDWATSDAVGHLAKFGRFDELAVGNNWQNAAIQRYVWSDIPGPASTPQVVILERTVGSHPDTGLEDAPYVISDERLILRVTGYYDIIRWAEAGAPLPRAP